MKASQLLTVIVLNFIGLSAPIFAKDAGLMQQLAQLEATSGGRLGIAALDLSNHRSIQYHANESFPMGCTSKVIGIAAILKKSMSNKQLLQEKIHYQKNDLTNWAPITKDHLKDGMTVAELCEASISYSDNTAMNLLTKKLGGPIGLNKFARSIQDQHFKLDHWWPEEAMATPTSHEDSTTPNAMTESLRKLVLGKVLNTSHREMLITWLKNNTTGNARIRAGVPKGWAVGDKTGSGFHYGTTNDIAVIWPPKCKPLVVTIFYSNNKKNAPHREDILASVTKKLLHSFGKSNHCLQSAFNRAMI